MSKHPIDSPGNVLKKALVDRGWTQDDLSVIIGKPRQAINEIISGRRGITADMAMALSIALGIPAEEWIRLDGVQKLSGVDLEPSAAIKRRVRIRELAPVREMERRQWIKPTCDETELEKQLCQFFGISSIDDEPFIAVSARAATSTIMLNPAQRAWCFRTKQLAQALHVPAYRPENSEKLVNAVRILAAYPSEARHISKTLAEFGVRFLLNEHLPTSKIDGAALWLDARSPVIAVSLRYDRVDAFWFTLMHELSHIVNCDASIDCNLVGEGQVPSAMKEDSERRADGDAAAYLIPTEILESFILRVSPLYSKTRIIQFAHRIRVHPGIIVGQLQHRGEVGYSANREMLVKIRDIVSATSITDGWGHTISLPLN